ncbi:MAG: HDOD domain-containing protein [Phycisphaerae bacterium]|nr:HDOD domain-containing protein [Phycisphaerae bacterium]
MTDVRIATLGLGVEPKPALHSGDWGDFSSKSKDCYYLDKMVELLERRLPSLRGKAGRVEHIATRLAIAFDLPQDAIMALRIGARYCDVGLQGVPDTLLSTNLAFDEENQRLTDSHVRLSGQLLSLGFYDFPAVLETVWFHHERVDGTGPLGVRGTDIPLTAQILAVADAIDSMYYGRSNRPRMDPDAIIAELHRRAASQFDARVVQVASRIRAEIFSFMIERDGPQSSDAEAEAAPPPGPASPAAEPPVCPPPAARPRAPRPAQATRSGSPAGSRQVSGVDQIAALPSVVCEVLMLAGNRHADRGELARAIERDVALTARVLALANSCGHGVERGRIATVDDAVARLGFNAVRQMAAGMAILRTVSREADASGAYIRLWEHSFAAALVNTLIDSGHSHRTGGDEYLIGLLHDMGKFMVIDSAPDQLQALAETAGLADEGTLLGHNHAELGAEMLHRWGLPEAIVTPVGEHHRTWDETQPFDPKDEPTLRGQLADGLALAFGFRSGLADYMPAIPASLLSRLPFLADVDVAALRQSLEERMRETVLLLGLFDELSSREPTPAPAADAEQPVVVYVPCEPCPIHVLAVWLAHGRGCTTFIEPLDSPTSGASATAPRIVDVSNGLPTPARLRAVHAMLKHAGGLLVLSKAWDGQDIGQPGDGWQVVREPLSLRQLNESLERLLPQLHMGSHHARQYFAPMAADGKPTSG